MYNTTDPPVNPSSTKLSKIPSVRPDTVHVPTTGGWDIAVGRNSAYHKQAQDLGAVVNQWRPGKDDTLTEDTDSSAVSNWDRRKEMRQAALDEHRRKRAISLNKKFFLDGGSYKDHTRNPDWVNKKFGLGKYKSQPAQAAQAAQSAQPAQAAQGVATGAALGVYPASPPIGTAVKALTGSYRKGGIFYQTK